jgi:hypothetical protein
MGLLADSICFPIPDPLGPVIEVIQVKFQCWEMAVAAGILGDRTNNKED